MTRDIAEVLEAELARSTLEPGGPAERVAYHPPCTLQHGQAVRGVVERILQRAGFELSPVADSHLCCGSAGTYSIYQPELAGRLRENRLGALLAGSPARVVTANIGCQSHLSAATATPVEHWIVALERRLST
jgi:glycolate oxidase iron-sulfur subunit